MKKPVFVLLIAALAFYVLLILTGPVSVLDATPDLDLGSGISMTPDGQIEIKNPSPPWPRRIPDESEYYGSTWP